MNTSLSPGWPTPHSHVIMALRLLQPLTSRDRHPRGWVVAWWSKRRANYQSPFGIRMLPGSQQRLLDDVLGLARVARQPERVAPETRGILVIAWLRQKGFRIRSVGGSGQSITSRYCNESTT